MLSSGLYSDKIKAVLREIGCNAHDAHIVAGISDKPIEVKLPNGIDDQFWIKDFGPGLSYDEVMNLYTTYFASTKQDSNDFTGGFGLGSKSPFSYTDNFMIVACHGGKERTFTAHIGNDGSPKIAMMGERDTTETGIKISFSVPKSDFAEFQQKAQRVFQYFTPVPTILGGDDIVGIKIKKDYGRFVFLEDSNTTIRLKMGNVVYPIDPMRVMHANVIWRAFSGSRGLMFIVPIGTVNVAASREELQYDPKGIAAIVAEMQHAVKCVALELEQECAKVTDWKSRCAFGATYNMMNMGINISVDVFKSAGITNAESLYGMCTSRYLIHEETNHKDNVLVSLCDGHTQANGYRMNRNSLVANGNKIAIPFVPDMVIVAGVATNASRRIRHALQNGVYKNVLSVHQAPTKVATQAEIDAAVARLVKTTGPMPVVDLASLPAPPITRMTKAKLAKGQFPDGDVLLELGGAVVKASTIPAGLKQYVRTTAHTAWGRRRSHCYMADGSYVGEWAWTNIMGHLPILQKFIDIKAPVYIANAEYKRMHIEKNPEWEPYETYLKRVLLDKKNIAKLRKHIKGYAPPHHDSYSPLAYLIYTKKNHPDIYDKLVPSFRKHSIHKEIEKAYTASLNTIGASQMQDLVAAYRTMAGIVTKDLSEIPDLDKSESVVNTKLSTKFQNITSTIIRDVAEISTKACVVMLTEALS